MAKPKVPDYLQELGFASYHQVAVWARNHLPLGNVKQSQRGFLRSDLNSLIWKELGLEAVQVEKVVEQLRREGFLQGHPHSNPGHLADALVGLVPFRRLSDLLSRLLGRDVKDHSYYTLQLN